MQGPGAALRLGEIAAGLGQRVLLVSDADVERLFAPRVRHSAEMFPRIVERALHDHCHETNPRQAQAQDYSRMLSRSM